MHVLVKAVSEQGGRLNFRKATLREWREAFASHLRRVGVAANATRRVIRGETRPRKTDAIYRAALRGVSTHLRDPLGAAAAERIPDRPEALAIRPVRETRRALERGWLATSETLQRQGQTTLADQTLRFVRSLPPARTEREWLRAGAQERRRGRNDPARDQAR